MSKSKQDHFLQLYQTVHDRFERFCRARACGDMPFEDLMNETLLIAYQKIEGLKKEGSFLSFLIGISLRVLANNQRKKKASPAADESLLLNYADPEDVIAKKFDVALLHKALALLPEEQREALILFEITGFSIKEIMEIQDRSESAVKQRLVRGRKALASIVKKELSYKTGDTL